MTGSGDMRYQTARDRQQPTTRNSRNAGKQHKCPQQEHQRNDISENYMEPNRPKSILDNLTRTRWG